MAGSASAATVYNNLPKPLPKNVVSNAFEARSTAEFGGQVQFAGTARNNPAVTVVMSSWACQEGYGATCKTVAGATFNQPITLNVYNVGVGGEVGSPVTSKTQVFAIPFRPSANNRLCTPNVENNVGYTSECWYGRATKIIFNLEGVKLPASAILSVAFNTSDYGAEKQRPKACNAFNPSRCPYDSLNVGLTEPANEEAPTPVLPSIGSNPQPADTYQNSTYAGFYCDGGAGGTGTFRLDAGCSTGYQPLFEVKASA